jgi:hypothetical protein
VKILVCILCVVAACSSTDPSPPPEGCPQPKEWVCWDAPGEQTRCECE